MFHSLFGSRKKSKGNKDGSDDNTSRTSDEYVVVDDNGGTIGSTSLYPNINRTPDSRAGPTYSPLPYALNSMEQIPIPTQSQNNESHLKFDMLSQVEFKLSPQLVSETDSVSWEILQRLCKDLVNPHVIDSFQYDFLSEKSVLVG